MIQDANYARIIGTIDPQTAEQLGHLKPTSDEAAEIIIGAGGTFTDGQFALIAEADESGDKRPIGYVNVSPHEFGTKVKREAIGRLRLPELGIAARVIAEQQEDYLSKRLG